MTQQTVLISGASSGIGAEIARRFSASGFDLLLLGRDESRLRQVQKQCQPARAEILAFDLKEVSKYTSAIQQKLSELSKLTILVNNAGQFVSGSFAETKTADWLSQFQINLLSAVELTQIAWPTFQKNKKGSVLNIASTLGIKPTPQTGAYSASKAAMINWTQSLAQEGGAYNIRANCLCPGIIDTPIHSFHQLSPAEKKSATEPMTQYQLLNSLGQTTDVAEAAYFLASDLSRWTTGAVLNVDGGIHAK